MEGDKRFEKVFLLWLTSILNLLKVGLILSGTGTTSSELSAKRPWLTGGYGSTCSAPNGAICMVERTLLHYADTVGHLHNTCKSSKAHKISPALSAPR